MTGVGESVAGGAPAAGAAILAGVRALDGPLRERAPEVEAARRLTPPVVDALRASGVFRMATPRAWGGPELDVPAQIEIIETLSRADASAGWCAMIGSDSGFYSAFLDDDVARALYPTLDAVTAGWLLPGGRLEPVAGGYRLSGRWSFGSGSTHADVIIGGAVVTEDGVPRVTDGRPEWRVAMLPADRWQVLDTWDTVGLAGSGSHDYTIADAFVPAEQTWLPGTASRRPGTLYAWPGMFVVNLLGVPLGVGRDACDVATGILADKVAFPAGTLVRDEPRVRAGLARARALVGASRAHVHDVVGRMWATLEAGDVPDTDQRAELVGCFVHTITSCREAVQLLVETTGTAAAHRSCPLQRQLRDLTMMGVHLTGQARMWEWAGGLWFGEPPPMPLF